MAMSFSSTLEADAFTSSPAFCSTAMTSLLEIPRSFAISWTRFFAIQFQTVAVPLIAAGPGGPKPRHGRLGVFGTSRTFEVRAERRIEAAPPLREACALT